MSDLKKNEREDFGLLPKISLGIFGLALIVALSASGMLFSGAETSALDKVRTKFQKVPTYSVVLEDMKEEGNFFKEYYEKFKVIGPATADKDVQTWNSDWIETSEDEFERLLPFLGMTVFSKIDGNATDEAGPPGYEYVGNERYGHWGPGGYWMWFGNGAFWGNNYRTGTVTRKDKQDYSSARGSGKPYFGRGKEYGTQGKFTKAEKPSFYTRNNAKKIASRAKFSDKVQHRIGRTSVAVRSRSGGVGK
jgi:hypothetical protein